jgi:hypothetical protein
VFPHHKQKLLVTVRALTSKILNVYAATHDRVSLPVYAERRKIGCFSAPRDRSGRIELDNAVPTTLGCCSAELAIADMADLRTKELPRCVQLEQTVTSIQVGSMCRFCSNLLARKISSSCPSSIVTKNSVLSLGCSCG